ncbi:MAG: hypothetical protein LUD03_07100, partial [Firmicutes bacterium]|nr:hypothetical protein [Bacillota bacterium]
DGGKLIRLGNAVCYKNKKPLNINKYASLFYANVKFSADIDIALRLYYTVSIAEIDKNISISYI